MCVATREACHLTMQHPDPDSPRTRSVETGSGRLRGLDHGTAFSFRNIPYGEPTGGGNRFRPPRPARPWPGTREAVAWGNSAPQVVAGGSAQPLSGWYTQVETLSEDCLNLNVFTPSLGDARRAVMVWLHGGGWRSFAGSAPGTDGAGLAQAGDVVVVTLNHRLNAFGFLPIPGDDPRFADAGNLGMLDILLALRWVRENISVFGGDPGNVTVFGQSGGGAKVAALLAMPAARGYFHKAIIQSSSGGMKILEPAEAKLVAQELAAVLGVPRLDGSALQAMPMQELLAAISRCRSYFRPVIDGRTLFKHPFERAALDAGAGVPLMVGCTDTETTWYLHQNAANFSLDRSQVTTRLCRFLGCDDAEVDRIVAAYGDQSPGATPSDLLIAITTDQLFKRNTYRMGALHSAGAPVFAYLFDRATPVCGGRLGAPHTSEIPFIFGTTRAAQGMVGEDGTLSATTRVMQQSWAQFALTGDPNNPNVPHWPSLGAGPQPVMALGPKPVVRQDPGGQARAALSNLPRYEYSNSRASFATD